jgi:hypothetical protein
MTDYAPNQRPASSARRPAACLCCFVLVALGLPVVSLGQFRRQDSRATSINRPLPANNQPPRIQRDTAGQCQGQIWRFETADEDRDDGVQTQGTLRIRPLEKGTRTLTLLIPDDDQAYASVGGHEIDLFDEWQELLGMRLYCSASWAPAPSADDETPNKKPPLMLKSLRLKTMEVTGEIRGVDDDGVLTIRARPLNGELWPEMTARSQQAANTRSTPRKVPSRSLKVQIIPDVARFVDADRRPLSAWDWELEAGQKVEAVIAYGRKGSILVELRRLPDEPNETENQRTARRGG